MKTTRKMLGATLLGAGLAMGLVGIARAESPPIEVSAADESALRAAVAQGGVIRLAFVGTVRLTNPLVIETNTVLEATGPGVILSGNALVRVLEVQTNVQLTLRNLTIADGLADRGGGLLNEGGEVTLFDCAFVRNRAIGAPGSDGQILSAEAPDTPSNLASLNGGNGQDAFGGAVYSSGSLVGTRCVFVENLAAGGQGGQGGYLPAKGGSPALGYYPTGGYQGSGGNGGFGYGGALHQVRGAIRLASCSFATNRAWGAAGGDAPDCQANLNSGSGGSGGFGGGGAIYQADGELVLDHGSATDNQAVGGNGGQVGHRFVGPDPQLPSGPGGKGGDAAGGFLASRSGVELTTCRIATNQAAGGRGGSGGSGQRATGKVGTPNPGGVGGAGGHAQGGGVWSLGMIRIVDTAGVGNRVIGGPGGAGGPMSGTPGVGGRGGDGKGGGLWMAGELQLEASAWVAGEAKGGAGGAGGNGGNSNQTGSGPIFELGGVAGVGATGGVGGRGAGGALLHRGSTAVTNVTLAENRAQGGPGGPGGMGGTIIYNRGQERLADGPGGSGGPGQGGAIVGEAGTLRLMHATMVRNEVVAGQGGAGASPGPLGTALGGALRSDGGTLRIASSIVAESVGAGNFHGPILDEGDNLSSDTSAELNGPGSRHNLDPLLGALGDYGGSTLTCPPLAGSPALDAVNPAACPAYDQRGVQRPLGAGCDVGAMEAPTLRPQEVNLTVSPSMLTTGTTARVQLTIRNPNDVLTLSNLVARIELPAGLQWVSGSLDHVLATLGPGEVFQTELIIEAVTTGNLLLNASVESSITGTKGVIAGTRLPVGSAPEILTGWGEWAGDGSARLRAWVVPQGTPAVGWFEYGSTNGWRARTSGQAIGAEFTPRPVTASVEGIGSGADLVYRVVASNAWGTSRSPDRTLPPQTILAACDPEALRSAVSAGGYWRLDCDGLIRLAAPWVVERDLVLDASGREVTLSGEDAVRIFEVRPGAELTLLHLTVKSGSSEKGGGLYNDGGVVRICDGTWRGNRAVGRPGGSGTAGGDATGGAIHSRGRLFLMETRLEGNTARGGAGAAYAFTGTGIMNSSPGGQAAGGAVLQEGPTFLAWDCTFLGNQAEGGQGGSGDPESGGGNGQPGGAAQGGALLLRGDRAWLLSSTLRENVCLAGAGGHGGGNPHRGFQQAGVGAAGGDAKGAALASHGELTVAETLIVSHRVSAGAGGRGGYEGPPYPRTLVGGPGGQAEGGALWTSNRFDLVNSTIVGNVALGGAGGKDGMGPGRAADGRALGGAQAHGGGDATLLHSTWLENRAAEGGTFALLGGRIRLANDIVMGGSPAFLGAWAVTDLGANLAADGLLGQPAWTSRVGTDPRLLPLADNGGPTWTIALATNSPALDAGTSVFAPDFDQRGFPRPSGAGSDIGACEVQITPPAPSASAWLRADGAVGMRFVVWPNQSVVLEATTDWTTWTGILTNRTDAAGVLEAVDDQVSQHAWRVFRVRKE